MAEEEEEEQEQEQEQEQGRRMRMRMRMRRKEKSLKEVTSLPNAPTLSPLRKRILPSKRKITTTTTTTTRNPNPSLTSCHRCKKKKKTTTELQTLESQWRIALLCRPCLGLVRGAGACSYCFLRLSEEEDIFLNCLRCFRRVHYACIPAHPYYVSASQLHPDSFSCVDCCPAPMWTNAAPPSAAALPDELELPRWVINGSKRVLKSCSRSLLLSPDGDGTGPALARSPLPDISLDLRDALRNRLADENTRTSIPSV